MAVGTSAYAHDTIERVRASAAGTAVPVFSFTSGDFSYYDHFDWLTEIDWYRRGGPGRVPQHAGTVV